ncbi:MAG: hypothetical protein WCI41_02550 [bacterium]
MTLSFLLSFSSNLFSQVGKEEHSRLDYEKANKLTSGWTQDKTMPRIWKRNDRNKAVALNCTGNNLTRVVIKQKGAANLTEEVKHPEPETVYVIFTFERDIKRVTGYYPQKPPFGFTLEITLCD